MKNSILSRLFAPLHRFASSARSVFALLTLLVAVPSAGWSFTVGNIIFNTTTTTFNTGVVPSPATINGYGFTWTSASNNQAQVNSPTLNRVLLVTSSGSTPTFVGFKSDDGTAFKLSSFGYTAATANYSTPATVTLRGYKGGVAVSGAVDTKQPTNNTGATPDTWDVSAISGFGNIDEVRITTDTANTFGSFRIYSINTQTAASPAPTITSVTGPAGGTYLTGQTLNFTVNYSAAVTVTGSPQLPLTIGSTARNATYASGSGSSALVFSYTVQGTDLDVNGIASASPLVLNGGTIQNGSTDASLTFTPPNTSTVLVGLQRVRNNISSGISVFVRPGGTSYTWTFGTGNNGTGPFTPILDWAFDNVTAFGWNLTRAHIEHSSDGGVNWTVYNSATGSFIPVAGKLWRCVDTTPGDPTTTNNVGNHWHLVATPGSTTGSGGTVIPDNAPTDITSDKSTIFSTAAQNDIVSTVTPVDTGDTLGGSWAIDSQSVPNLFTLTFDNTTGNTATLKLGTGTVPAIGQTPTVTLRYYDVYQTDNSGVPIPGQGFSKTLTFTVVSEVSNDLTLGNDLPVNTFTTNTQTAPSVAALTTGNLAVVWQSASQGGKSPTTNSGIYGQLLSSTGAAVGSEFVVSNAGAAVDEIAPAVTALAAGRYVVAYSKKSGADYDIAYRIVEANGTVGAQLIANSTTAGDQSAPAIVTLTDGSFVIAWYSSTSEIRARQFAAAAGAPVAGEVLFDSAGFYASVAALSSGSYAVAWADNGIGEVKVKVNGGSTVSTGIFSAYYAGPRLAGLTGGGFVVASESYNFGTARSQVEATRYNDSGVIQGAKFQVNTVSTGNRFEASIAALTGGGFVVGWAADNGDFDFNGIFGRRYTALGVAVDASEFEINQHRAGDQSFPAMTAMPSDAFATVWTDSSAGTPPGDIEARILTVAAPTGPTVTATTTSVNANASSITITGTGFDTTAANNTVALTPTGTGTVTAATATSLTVSVSGLRGGPLNAVVTNGNGNSGAAVQVATVKPVVTQNLVTTFYNGVASVTFSGLGFDPTAANNTVAFPGAVFGTVSSATATSLTVTITSAVSWGAYTGPFTANVTTNGQSSGVVQIGNVAAGVPPVPEIAVTETGVGNIPDNTATFSFGTTAVGTFVTKVFTVTNSGTANLTLANLTVPSGFSILSNFTLTTLTPGNNATFQIRMTAGAAGTPSGTLTFDNNDADENPYNFTISGTVNAPDTVPPVISGTPANITNIEATSPAGATVTFAAPTALDAVDGPRPVTCVPPSGSTFPVGITTVVCSASDLSSNSAQTSFTISVLDRTPPTIVGTPANITGIVATGPGGAVVTFASPTANDIVDGSVAVVCVLPSGSTFPVGLSTVVCTATDSHGNSANTSFTITVDPLPAEIAVSYNGNDVADGSTTFATLNGTDFGNVPVQGVTADHVFTITNSGGTALTLGSVTAGGDFTVTQPTSPVAANGGTSTFTVSFNPSATGTRNATITFSNDDSNENPFNFDVQGVGTGPQTFDLAGNPVSNTPFDGGQTYIYSAGPPPPPPVAPVVSTSGEGVVTGGNAPDPTGADSGLDFSYVTRSGFIAENGNLAFASELTGAGVDATNFKGFFKHDGTSLKRLARTGDNAPETGATAAKFSDLPLIPGINDDGQVTLFAQLATNPASTPATTVDNDTGLWSELGGTGFQILIRENDQIPGLPAGVLLDRFGSGCFATAKLLDSPPGTGRGEAAFTATFKGGSTDSALLRTSIIGADTTAVSVVAQENAAAPGVTGESFSILNGSYTDAVRMDAQGNIVFGAVLKPSGKTSIYYQPVTGGTPVKAMVAGDAAAGTTGATFLALDLPIMGDSGTFSFRGVLNMDGDNAANDKNDGIWRGTVAGGFTNILRRGDSNTNRLGLFANGTIKAGNIYSGWINNNNRGAWLGWVDSAGDGISAYPADTFGIYTDMSDTMKLLISSGDTAPGMPVGTTMFYVDHPVVSGGGQNNYLAFLATVTGGGTAASNNKGIWRSLNGAAPTLVLRTGDSMTVTPGGSKVIANVDIPGSNDAAHVWETPVMDGTGRLLVNVSFVDGTTTQVIIP